VKARLACAVGACLGLAGFLRAEPAVVDRYVVRQKAGEAFADVLHLEFSREFGCLYLKAVSVSDTPFVSALVGYQGTGGAWSRLAGIDVAGAGTLFSEVPAPSDSVALSASLKGRRHPASDYALAEVGAAAYSLASGKPVPTEALALDPERGRRIALGPIDLARRMAGADGRARLAVQLFDRAPGQSGAARVSLALSWRPEYFRGESAQLAAAPQADYARKAAAILHAAWEDFPVAPGCDLKALLPGAEEALASALALDLLALYAPGRALPGKAGPTGYYPLPLDLDAPEVARLIYASGASPYLAGYLARHYRAGKPLYSRGLAEAEGRLFGLAYAWSDYRPATEAEGMAMATAALGYYVHGVEYTLSTGSVPGTDVYYADPGAAEDWAGGTSPPSPRPLASPPPGLAYGWKSPFGKAAGSPGPLQGNPLPYAKGGVDNPRSFAYKMTEQLRTRVRKALPSPQPKAPSPGPSPATYVQDSTKAYPSKKLPRPSQTPAAPLGVDTPDNYWKPAEFPSSAYVEADGALYPKGLAADAREPAKALRPFLPGAYPGSALEQRAGVDATGFFLGVVAASGARAAFRAPGDDAVAVRLGTYLDMAAPAAGERPAPGLDSRGKPLYAVTSGLEGIASYRMSRAGFERSSFIVPILEEARPGDLVLHLGSDEEEADGPPARDPLRVGFVVRPGTKAEDILVVDIAEGMACMRLGPLSAFDAKGRYHIRRLSFLKEGPAPAVQSEWDVLDDEPTSLSLELRSPGRNGLELRWIQNTGRYLEFNAILSAWNAAGKPLDLSALTAAGGACAVSLEPPLDRFLPPPGDPKRKQGNLFMNAGPGFDIVARPAEGYDAQKAILLARFLRKEDGHYAIDPLETAVCDERGLPKPNRGSFALVKDWQSQGYTLWYRENEAYATSSFGIRPLREGIRPGDDIFLCFGLRHPEQGPPIMAAPADAEDYLAVVDHKLLWRANLYIDQGARDWNSLEENRWNAPPSPEARASALNPAWGKDDTGAWVWGYNDWNRSYAFTATYNLGALPAPTDALLAGGQTIVLHPSVWATGVEISGSVAYDYSGQDNPFVFNAKLDQARLLMGQFFNQQGARYLKPRFEWPANMDSFDAYSKYAFATKKAAFEAGIRASLDPYESHMPPAQGTAWAFKAYIGVDEWGEYRSGEAVACSTYPDGKALPWAPDDDKVKESDFPKTIDGHRCYPYLPGLNNSQFQYKNGSTDVEKYIALCAHAGKAAGTDCVSFVMNSAAYSGNPYDVLGNLGDRWWGDGRSGAEYISDIKIGTDTEDLQRIVGWDNGVIDKKTGATQYLNLTIVVPGDILYYYSKEGYHVSIIKEISGDDINRVQIIESVCGKYGNNGGTIYSVAANRTVLNMKNLAKSWIIGRIINSEE
jgi:hypothetical protein